MNQSRIQQILTIFIAAVWLVNGLVCKVLNIVPRHTEIVARILGDTHSRLFTLLIGVSEIIMAVWIFCRVWTRLNAIAQIVVIILMNVLEFILVPDLLLWGRANALFALLFSLLVFHNEFNLNRKLALQR